MIEQYPKTADQQQVYRGADDAHAYVNVACEKWATDQVRNEHTHVKMEKTNPRMCLATRSRST